MQGSILALIIVALVALQIYGIGKFAAHEEAQAQCTVTRYPEGYFPPGCRQ